MIHLIAIFLILPSLMVVVEGFETFTVPIELIPFNHYGKESQLIDLRTNNNKTLYFYDKQKTDFTNNNKNIHFYVFWPTNDTNTRFDICIFPDLICANGIQDFGTSVKFTPQMFAIVNSNSTLDIVIRITTYPQFVSEKGTDWVSVILFIIVLIMGISIFAVFCVYCCSWTIVKLKNLGDNNETSVFQKYFAKTYST